MIEFTYLSNLDLMDTYKNPQQCQIQQATIEKIIQVLSRAENKSLVWNFVYFIKNKTSFKAKQNSEWHKKILCFLFFGIQIQHNLLNNLDGCDSYLMYIDEKSHPTITSSSPKGKEGDELFIIDLTERLSILTAWRQRLYSKQSQNTNGQTENDIERANKSIAQLEKQRLERLAVSGESRQPLTYEEVEVPGDGHCLYTAVGLYVGRDQKQLRGQVADELESQLQTYEPFLELKSQQTSKQYIEGVRSGSEWAGNAEIMALMHLLQRPIIVVRPGENSQRRIQNLTDAERKYSVKEPILVKYNDKNHYNGLILVAQGNPNAPLQNQKSALEEKLTTLNTSHTRLDGQNWLNPRDRLNESRKKLNEKLKDKNLFKTDIEKRIRAIREYHDEVKKILQDILNHCIDLIIPPLDPPKFCLTALGSASRKELLPYSDLECLLLVDDSKDKNWDEPELTPKAKYLKLWYDFFQFFMLTFGESMNKTPGFQLDMGGHPTSLEHRQTPVNLMQTLKNLPLAKNKF